MIKVVYCTWMEWYLDGEATWLVAPQSGSKDWRLEVKTDLVNLKFSDREPAFSGRQIKGIVLGSWQSSSCIPLAPWQSWVPSHEKCPATKRLFFSGYSIPSFVTSNTPSFTQNFADIYSHQNWIKMWNISMTLQRSSSNFQHPWTEWPLFSTAKPSSFNPLIQLLQWHEREKLRQHRADGSNF